MEPTMPTEQWYSTTDLARKTGTSRKTVWRWIHDGKLNSIRYGARHRIHESEWRRFFADCNNTRRTKPQRCSGRTDMQRVHPSRRK